MDSLWFGFRTTMVVVGGLQILLSLQIIAGGVTPMLSGVGIPSEVLASPYYYDAMLFLFYHQFVVGAILVTLGAFAHGLTMGLRIWIVRLLSLLYCGYAYLDLRASSFPFGTHLYTGPQSFLPPILSVVFALLILQLNVRRRGTATV